MLSGHESDNRKFDKITHIARLKTNFRRYGANVQLCSSQSSGILAFVYKKFNFLGGEFTSDSFILFLSGTYCDW